MDKDFEDRIQEAMERDRKRKALEMLMPNIAPFRWFEINDNIIYRPYVPVVTDDTIKDKLKKGD